MMMKLVALFISLLVVFVLAEPETHMDLFLSTPKTMPFPAWMVRPIGGGANVISASCNYSFSTTQISMQASPNGSIYFNTDGKLTWNQTGFEVSCAFNVATGEIVEIVLYDSQDPNAWKFLSQNVTPGAAGQSPSGYGIQRIYENEYLWVGWRHITYLDLVKNVFRTWEPINVQVEGGQPGIASCRLYFLTPYHWQYTKAETHKVPGWGIFLLFFMCLFIVSIIGFVGYWFLIGRKQSHPYSPVS